MREEPVPELAEALARGGEAGGLIADHDWAATALGPMKGWPARLKAAVAVVLRSPFPMHIAWGPDLLQFYNDAYRPVLGSTKHPAIGMPLADTFPEAFESFILPRFSRALAGEAYYTDDELFPVDRHGWLEESHFAYSYNPLDGDDGQVAGVLTQCMEITERVVGERRLNVLSDLAAATAAASSPDEVVEVAVDLLSTRPGVPWAAVVEVTGRDAAVVVAGGLEGPPGRLAMGGAELRALMDGERHCIVPTDDLGLPVGWVEGWPVPSTAGRVLPLDDDLLFVFGLHPGRLLDEGYLDFHELVAEAIVSARRRATREAEARDHLESLRQLDRAKDVFLSDVSHELRTPLALVSGTLEELAPHVAADAEAAELVDMGRRNVERLARVVDSLLTFGQVAAGVVPAPETCDAAAVTARVCEAFRPALVRGGLELQSDVPGEAVRVPLPASAWESVVSNLLSNALKFTLEGHVAVSLRPVGGEAVLAVADTGVGIRPEHQEMVFERFYRSRGGPARSEEGAGIGLALVAGLAARHGGRVELDSAVGHGSTFTVAVPAVAADEVAGEPAAEAPAPKGSGRSGRPAPDRRWLVLVADDNDDLRALMARVLGRVWRVATARNGAEALDLARWETPDVVVTDVMMPGMDGEALLAALRAEPRFADVATVVLTGAGEDRVPAGADAVLAKPFALDALVAEVEDLMASRSGT